VQAGWGIAATMAGTVVGGRAVCAPVALNRSLWLFFNAGAIGNLRLLGAGPVLAAGCRGCWWRWLGELAGGNGGSGCFVALPMSLCKSAFSPRPHTALLLGVYAERVHPGRPGRMGGV